MARVEVSTSIARSPEDVFAFVADMRNEHRWHTDVLEAQLQGEGPVERGAKFWVRVKPSMGVSEGSFRVEEYQPPHVIALRGAMGKMKAGVTHSVEPEGEGSRFTRRIEVTPPGPAILMTPVIKRMIRKANLGFIANLKRVLEEG
jgi:uncharacterized protein YndB with AHSA1/START domain